MDRIPKRIKSQTGRDSEWTKSQTEQRLDFRDSDCKKNFHKTQARDDQK